MRLTEKILPALILILISFGSAIVAESAPKPKYGSQTTRLVDSQDWVRKHPAPAFWSLMPYYLPQQSGSACSLASVTMIVNASRSALKLTSDDKLLTQSGLLDRVKISAWSQATGSLGRGVTLDLLGQYAEASLKAVGLTPQVKIVYADVAGGPTEKEWNLALSELESKSGIFILMNFNQKVFTEDEEAGHIAPIAAWDRDKDRVLVMDPDREWYEPYWVPRKLAFTAMATKDPASSKNRGFVLITVRQ